MKEGERKAISIMKVNKEGKKDHTVIRVSLFKEDNLTSLIFNLRQEDDERVTNELFCSHCYMRYYHLQT